VSLVVALDSGPLSLLTQRPDHREAENCRNRLASHLASGPHFLVPAIADYELRRELIRAGKTAAVSRLDRFIVAVAVPDRYLPPISSAFRKAAELWAKIRNQGLPTSSNNSLDGDVLLAAQLLDSKWATTQLVVATSNPKHISRFLNAAEWQTILPPDIIPPP